MCSSIFGVYDRYEHQYLSVRYRKKLRKCRINFFNFDYKTILSLYVAKLVGMFSRRRKTYLINSITLQVLNNGTENIQINLDGLAAFSKAVIVTYLFLIAIDIMNTRFVKMILRKFLQLLNVSKSQKNVSKKLFK